MRVGLISDTHGLLRPQARSFLEGSDHIIHAGDICEPRTLEDLSALAPLTAVRGNNDHGAWAERLPPGADVLIGEVLIRVVHDLADLADVERGLCADGLGSNGAAPARVVISGHSHKPSVKERDGILYVNPGSAGPRRFKLPITVGELLIDGRSVSARIVEL